jgi:hypothetical protein
MFVSMVSPSITRVTSTSGQPAQLITVCGGPGPIAGSDGIAGVLPLEQATSRAANTVVARVRRMCHRVDPEGGLLLEGRWRAPYMAERYGATVAVDSPMCQSRPGRRSVVLLGASVGKVGGTGTRYRIGKRENMGTRSQISWCEISAMYDAGRLTVQVQRILNMSPTEHNVRGSV